MKIFMETHQQVQQPTVEGWKSVEQLNKSPSAPHSKLSMELKVFGQNKNFYHVVVGDLLGGDQRSDQTTTQS